MKMYQCFKSWPHKEYSGFDFMGYSVFTFDEF